MPKAQSKGAGGQKKKRIQQGVNEQQQNEQIDSEDKEDLQDSCTKNLIDEKIAAFFEDRSFFYDIENEHYKNRCENGFTR